MYSFLIKYKKHIAILERTCINDKRFLILFLIISLGFVLTVKNYILLYLSIDDRLHFSKTRDKDVYVIDTQGCQIPALKAYDSTVHKIMNREYSFRPCPKKDTALVDTNSTHIWIVKKNVKHHYNFSKEENPHTWNLPTVWCCYQQFYGQEIIINITQLVLNKCIVFRDIIDVNPDYEFVIVLCYYKNTKVYHKLLAYTPKKLILRKGMTPQLGSNSQYNVLVIGVDSVSQMNFRRVMPKTWELLKSFEAVELLGYNKVGDNTFSNVVPLLMGLRHTALQTICIPYREATFDSCPLVWKRFKQAGYYTAFAEDTSTYGIFNFLRGGFHEFPTDYYLDPFNRLAEIFGNNYNAIYKRILCLQERYMNQVLLDYIEELTKTLANSKLFGFFWEMNLSHEELNGAKAIDDGYKNFFKRLNESGYLQKTVVIFLSDHGMRFGDMLLTAERGWLENRLPFLYVLVPPSFRANYSLACNFLRKNRKRLTTPYDIHKTLLDLIDLKNIENDNIIFRSKQHFTKDTGISLFLPIPSNRTCQMANIDDTWCTCHKISQVLVVTSDILNASNDLILHLNTLLSGHSQCANLRLSGIINVMKMTMSHSNETRLTVVVQAEPGGGQFEGFMQKVGKTWQPVGTVTRHNRYGDQSHCIHLYELKMYCYCKKLLNIVRKTDYKIRTKMYSVSPK